MANPFKFLTGPAPTKNIFGRAVNLVPLKALISGALTLGALTLAITVYPTPMHTECRPIRAAMARAVPATRSTSATARP